MDLLDTALRVALVDFKMRTDDRTELFAETGKLANLSDIYDDTLHVVKALCLGIMDPQDYLERQTLAS